MFGTESIVELINCISRKVKSTYRIPFYAKQLLLFIGVYLQIQVYGQSIVINEISQGTSGSQEYVEFLVTGPALVNCDDVPPCIDLRGWIFDDNNGYLNGGATSGVGIAAGAVRFSYDPFWSCIPVGTVLVIYNDGDPNPDLPAVDADMTDGNCQLSIPISSALFERHPTLPSSSDANYSNTGWVSGGSWTSISMANSQDGFQIYNPSNLTSPVFSIGWGADNTLGNIWMGGSSATGDVFYATDCDYTNPTSWVQGSASSEQTPGTPNNVAQADCIGQTNANCNPPIVTITSTPATCGNCDGTATATIAGGTSPFELTWSPAPAIGQGTTEISGLCAGDYELLLIDDNGTGCSLSTPVTISASGDAIFPTASNPSPISVQCVNDIPAPDPLVVTDEADNGTIPIVTWEDDSSNGATCPQIITRRYLVTDDCGNYIFVTQTITVDDNINPTATAPANTTYVCIADVPAASVADITDEADNCTANPTVIYNGETTSGNCPLTITRTWDVSDDCGNTITVTQIITVDDNINPTATTPANATFDCINDVPAASAADITDEADNCTANPTVVYNGETTSGTCPLIITRTWDVSDNCGNTITVTQIITVEDTTDPFGTAPSNISVQCTADIPAADINEVTNVSDNCTSTPIVSFVGDLSDGNTCPETITRTYSIVDNCGNETLLTQLITINDVINPLGNAPADVAVQCPTDTPAVDVNSLTGVSDNCTVAPVITHIGDVSNGQTCPEVITRTYRITDDCGNFIEVDQIITINDDIAPVGAAPADVAVQCNADIPAVDVTALVGVSDNCSAAPVVTHVGDVSNGQTCPEVITRAYRIEDECGNFIEVDQIITINDNVAPVGTAPAPLVVECATDVPAPDITSVTGVADNCTAAPVVAFVSDVSDNNVCNGEVITRTYSITDDCGNSINVTQTITIDSYTPTYNLAYTDPTQCGADDGTITVSGLDPNTTYAFEYNGNPSQNITTDANGDYVITGLPSGSYSVFTVSDADCPACSTTDNTSFNLIEPNAPPIDAGPDLQVCEGTAVTLTAVNPDGANISWNNGVTDGVAFTPVAGTLNYTVTADLAGCISSDVVTVTVYAVPAIDPILDVTQCDTQTLPAITGTNLTGNEAFYTAPNGGGTQLNPGDVITTAGANTIYVYCETGTTPNCFDETSFVVTINLTPIIDPILDVTQCDTYTLPAITGTNLTGNEAFYTAPNGGGTQLNPGDLITTAGANTIYVYDQTATTPNCFDETSFVVTINLTPVIDPILDVTQCDTYTLPAIAGTNLTGNEAYYTAPNGGGTQLNPGDLITTAGANTIYVFDQTATTPNCFDETSFVVTINLTPALDPVGDVVICDEFTFADILGSNLTGNEAYYTAPNGGGTQYTPGDIFNTPGLSTIYVYDATGTTPDCFDEVSFTINVSITPVLTPTGSNPTQCAANDGSITLSGLTPGATYTVGYTANGTPVGPVVLAANAAGEVIISGLTAGSYTNFIVELNNCIGNDNTVINLVDPNAPTINAGPDVEVCEGDEITLTAVNPDGAIISWNNSITDGTPFNQNPGITTYTATANLDNCIATDQVEVTVIPAPIIDAGPDLFICEGESVTLTATGANTYIWDNGISNGIPFTPNQTTVYTVSGASNSCVGSDIVTVTVHPLANVSFTADNLTGCAPASFTLTNTSNLPGEGCVWTLSNGVTLYGCENVTAFLSTAGCIDVTLTVTTIDGCTSSAFYPSYICVENNPIANFTGEPLVVTTTNSEVNFINGSFGAADYAWNFGDGTTSFVENPSHIFDGSEEGNYTVQLIALSQFGCSDTAYAIIEVQEDLIFYVPNTFTPDGDNYNETFQPIFTSGFDPYDFNLLIFNRWGEILFESNNANIGWDGTYGGNLVKDGTYIWKIEFKTKYTDERQVHVGHVNVLK